MLTPSTTRVASAYKGQVSQDVLRAFMQDYWNMTFPNPLDPSMRVWSYADDDGERLPLIMTELRTQNGFIHMSAIVSPEKQGTGMASEVLKMIVKLADKHGVAITLTPKPFGRVDNALSQSNLAAWYRRYGWVKDPNYSGSAMIRYPTTT